MSANRWQALYRFEKRRFLALSTVYVALNMLMVMPEQVCSDTQRNVSVDEGLNGAAAERMAGFLVVVHNDSFPGLLPAIFEEVAIGLAFLANVEQQTRATAGDVIEEAGLDEVGWMGTNLSDWPFLSVR